MNRSIPRLANRLLLLALVWVLGCSTSSQLWRADQLASAGRYQEAVSRYLTIIQTRPGTDAAWTASLRIATIYEEKLNRPEDAIRMYREIARGHAGTSQALEALWRLGMYHFDRKEYTKAIPYFAQVVLDFPKSKRSHEARLQLGACYEGLDRPQEALGIYEDFRHYVSDSAEMAEVLWREARLYDGPLNRRDRAVALYRELTDRYPDSEQGIQAQGRLRELGAQPPARPEMEEGLRPVGPPTRPNAAQILQSWEPSDVFGINARDLILGGEGMFGGEELRESLAGDGALLDDAVYNMGLMFAMTGEYAKAGACLERALELGIQEANLYLQLGIAYREVGETARAREMFRRLNAKNPRALEGLMQEAERAQAAGDLDGARRRYQALLGISAEMDARIARRLAEIEPDGEKH